MSILKKTLLAGTAVSFAGIAINLIVGIGFKVLLARILNPEDFGMVNIGFSILIIAGTLSYLGYAQGISRFIGYYTGSNQSAKIKPGLASILFCTVFVSLFCSFCVYFFSDSLAEKWFHDRNLTPVLMIFAVGIPFFAVAKVLNGSLRGLKKIHLMILTDQILWRILPLIIFIVLFFLFGMQIEGAAWAYVTGTMVMAITAIFFVCRETTPLPGHMSFSKNEFIEISRFSLPLSLSTLMNQLRGKMDIFFIGLFFSFDKVGIFAVAMTLTSMLNIFLSSVATIFNPVASELYGKGDIDKLSSILSLSSKWLFILVFPAVLFLVFFSQYSVTILFGQDYKSAAPLVVVLAICQFFKAVFGLTVPVLLSIGRSSTVFIINAMCLGLSLLLYLILIPNFGLIGGAFAAGAAMIFQQVCLFFVVRRYVVLRLLKVKSIFYAAYCIILIIFVKWFFDAQINDIYSMIAVAILFYLLSLFGVLITKQVEKKDVQLFVQKIWNVGH